MSEEYRGDWVIIATAALTDRHRVFSFNAVITTVCVPIPYCIHITEASLSCDAPLPSAGVGFAVQRPALLEKISWC